MTPKLLISFLCLVSLVTHMTALQTGYSLGNDSNSSSGSVRFIKCVVMQRDTEKY